MTVRVYSHSRYRNETLVEFVQAEMDRDFHNPYAPGSLEWNRERDKLYTLSSLFGALLSSLANTATEEEIRNLLQSHPFNVTYDDIHFEEERRWPALVTLILSSQEGLDELRVQLDAAEKLVRT